MNAGVRIVELPIPTYYGDEICRVNGLAYAKNVMLAVLQNVAHRSGVLYQRRFDTSVQGNQHYDLKLGYASSHTYAIDAVPAGARVVDIGAGPGGPARELVKKGCQVTVVDRYPPAEHDPRITVIQQSLEDELRFDPNRYEYLLMLDIIEHVRDPERFLDRVRSTFDYEPKRLILTTPNVAFIVQRLMLLFGQFNYGKAGILDRDHVRLFNMRSLQHLLRDAGFQNIHVRGVPAPFPKALGDGVLGRSALAINLFLIRISKTLFSYQFFVEANSTPSVDFIVEDTRRQSLRAPAAANTQG
jgi:2-polyprenyl-3-methyl-5-hydroxy-6-metoxy-1,4-benzoquinol methylase